MEYYNALKYIGAFFVVLAAIYAWFIEPRVIRIMEEKLNGLRAELSKSGNERAKERRNNFDDRYYPKVDAARLESTVGNIKDDVEVIKQDVKSLLKHNKIE